MSASLVGSEMCIRDSQQSTNKAPTKHQQSTSKAPTKHQQSTSKAPTKPVSYTHLTLPTICSV
eukprot:16136-Alexandrium_andersonii.AAC.1